MRVFKGLRKELQGTEEGRLGLYRHQIDAATMLLEQKCCRHIVVGNSNNGIVV